MSIPLWLQCIFWCYFQQDNAPSQSSNHLRLVSWTWQLVHFTQMASAITRSQSNRAALGCGGTRDSHHGCAADKSAATVWCYHVNMDQNLGGISQFWKQKGVRPGTSEVYHIKWPVSVYIYISLSIITFLSRTNTWASVKEYNIFWNEENKQCTKHSLTHKEMGLLCVIVGFIVAQGDREQNPLSGTGAYPSFCVVSFNQKDSITNTCNLGDRQRERKLNFMWKGTRKHK